MKQGILVGADKNIEWLLSWWWKYYSLYNNYPVAFADFGLSPEGLKWCKQHGKVISIKSPSHVIASKKAVSPKQAQVWEEKYTLSKYPLAKMWKVRNAWFKKPLAFLCTPFDETIWIDLDCEVCAPVVSLFEIWDRSNELAIAKEVERPSKDLKLYNSGVIAFRKNAPFITAWAKLCIRQNKKYLTDQHALSHLLLTTNVPFQQLPNIFNWNVCGQRDIPLTPVIIHWLSAWGKEFIRTHGGYHDSLKNN